VSHRIRGAAKAMVTRHDGPPMRQTIADARENRKVVILNDDVSAPCRIDKGAGRTPSSHTPIKRVPARGRAARLWITAAFLTTTFLTTAFFGATAGALDVERDQASRAGEKSVQLAQATTDDPEDRQKALDQEHRRAELLAGELTTVRHLEMLLTLQKARVESAQFKQLPENEHAALVKSLQRERDQLKQAAESGVAELCKLLPGDPAERLVQDLAAARRDVETQTALATKASDDASQLKQVAEKDSAELKRSLQKEHERADALAKDLSMARAAIYAYEAQARKANDQAAAPQQAAENGAAALRKSLQQEQERAARLQQDLVAARRDVETQTALAAKAGAEAARLKATEDSSAESQKSLQQERDKTARLERELASERKTKDFPAASGVVTAGRLTQDKQPGADAIRPVAANQITAAAARSDDARPDQVNVAEVARLVARASVLLGQGDIGSARIVLERAAETGNAQASFALAETYDPLVLRKWGAYGTLGDAAKARDLYARAQAGGVKEARERFDALRP